MLLPIIFYFILLADVTTNIVWQMLWPHILVQCGGRCYSQVAGGKATVGWVDIKWLMLLPQSRCYSNGSMTYFNFSSGMLNRTSSHMCGRWYLPIFLFKEVLVLPSHNVEIFNTYVVTSGVKVVKYGRESLLVFLEPLPKSP